MARYRTKVELVDAWQLTDAMIDAPHPSDLHIKGIIYDPPQRCAFIVCESTRVWVGDWIIRGENGELFRCAAEDFPGRYEKFAVPKCVVQVQAEVGEAVHQLKKLRLN